MSWSRAPARSVRDELRADDSGRYSVVLTDSAPGDFEEVVECVACECKSSSCFRGCKGWVILRRRNGSTLALCPECAGTSHGRRRARSD